jgi:hypothetical protein
MNRPLVAVLAAALALGATTSGASALTSVQLSDFQFRLIDLDPNDGIAPSIDLSAYPGSRAYAGGNLDQGSSVFGPALITASYESGFLELASITGNLASGGSATTLATVGDFPRNYRVAESTIILGVPDATSLFTLSPRTELVISGTVDMRASTSQVDGFTGFAQGVAEFALSTAPIGFNDFDRAFAIINADGDSDRSQQSDLSVALSNTTDASMQGGFYVHMSSDASVFPFSTAVPEPGNLPLMLAALGGMASMVRGRRRSN